MQNSTTAVGRIRRLRYATPVVLIALTLLASAPLSLTALGQSAPPVDDPFLAFDMVSPRVLEVQSGPGDVRLLDASGKQVPLTGPGVQVSGTTLRVFPPRLPEGSYRLVYPAGELEVTVGDPTVFESSAEASNNNDARLFVAVTATLVALAVFLRRNRRAAILLSLAGFGALVLTVIAFYAPISPGNREQEVLVRDDSSYDPCAAAVPVRLASCMEDYTLRVLLARGPQAASDELLRLSRDPNSPRARVCHEPAHALGIATWLSTRSVPESLNSAFTDCSLGYVHGMLQVLGTYSTDQEFAQRVVEFCNGLDEMYRAGRLTDAPSSESATLLGCHHGAGHSAMWRVNEDLTRALPICAGYDLPAQREECAVGAVMEWVYASQRAAVLDRPQDAPLPAVSQPLELCELADGPLSPGCVEGAVTAVGPEQVDETIDWCLARPEVLQACTHSLARRVVQMEINENQPVLGRASAICERLSSSPGNTYCSESFGYMLLFLRRDLDMTKDFCASLSVLQVDGCMRGIERVREYARAVGDSSLMFPE